MSSGRSANPARREPASRPAILEEGAGPGKAMTTTIKITPGQVWADKDKRKPARRLRVERYDGGRYVELLDVRTSRTTRIEEWGLRARFRLEEEEQ